MNKMWVVTWTNHVVGQISSDSIKCFEEHETALAFAKLMSGNYQYVNMYAEEAKQWDS
jgi:hypothetical protein